ncbi:hypothetical protein GCM10011587_09350 [Pyruvatibacter mobilis]|nr:hypothetical protein GCM10011587_09350 [Pyruvatibacter mobilis]
MNARFVGFLATRLPVIPAQHGGAARFERARNTKARPAKAEHGYALSVKTGDRDHGWERLSSVA